MNGKVVKSVIIVIGIVSIIGILLIGNYNSTLTTNDNWCHSAERGYKCK